LKLFGRAAFLIRWWPAIVEKIKISKSGDRWRLPMIWQNTDHQKMVAIKDPRIDDRNDAEKPDEDTSRLRQDSLGLSLTTKDNSSASPSD
jgi:hypothetical protein